MSVAETMKAITDCSKKLIEAPRYNVGDFVGVYGYETEVRIYDIRWEGSCFVYKVYLADEETWLYDDDIAYKKDEMIEGLAKESDDFEKMYMESEKRYEEEYSKGEYCHEQSFKWGFQEGYDYAHENEKLEINLKNGYEFKDDNGNVINATKIVLEKKKKEYPKTYEECRDYIESCHVEPFCADIVATGYKSRLIESFARLLICRDAYWKIVGEEMGLGKPWEPDWADTEIKYCIANSSIGIKKSNTYDFTRILSFPTEEMRDTFYENFKSEIESCKELL